LSNSSRKFEILNVRIDATDILSVCASLEHWIRTSAKVYVCIAPVSTLVECQGNKKYLDIVNNAAAVTPDGMPLVWVGKWKGFKNIRRTYGPDLMIAVCAEGQDKGYKHYFYGATPETCRLLEVNLKKRFPRMSIAGKFSPPFRDLSEEEDNQIVESINRANPDILWVGLGSPKQDYWMYYHRDRLNVPVMVGVGAAFDFLAGTKPQAPRWMQRSGLEWLFRFCCEPKRLWRRYLIGNSKFIFYLLKDCFRKNKERQ